MKTLLCILLFSTVTFGQMADTQTQADREKSKCPVAGVIGSGTADALPLWISPHSLGNSATATQGIANGDVTDGSGTAPYAILLNSPTPETEVAVLEIHNRYASGINIFTHRTATSRGPALNFASSHGTKASPTPSLFDDALMIISASGYDGTSYYRCSSSACIEAHADEDWSVGHRGSRLDFYTIPNGGVQALPRLVVQSNGTFLFGEPDGSSGALNTIPMLKTTLNPASVAFRLGDDSAGAPLTVGSLGITASHTPATAFDACAAGTIAWDANFVYVCVSTNTWRRSALAAW